MIATKRKTGVKRLFTAIMAVLMLCTVMATTAFAKKSANTTREMAGMSTVSRAF